MNKSASLSWEIKSNPTAIQPESFQTPKVGLLFFFSLMCLTFYGINNANKEEIIFAEH